jgi:predicted dehydrogenase
MSRLEVIADVDEARAAQLAQRYGCRHTVRWQDALDDANVDLVVVSTTNIYLAPIAIAALSAGKHVLCEKPMGRNAREANEIASAARASGRVLKVGFTLRFHPAIRRAHELSTSGQLGPLFFVHATYGHGGRLGYEKEWRGNAEQAGGGELLDQGVHLLDLSRWFLGDVEVAAALTPRWYWDVEPLEDNAFVLLRGHHGEVASLHTSWTIWKNRFSFEVVGRDGYAKVEGLGGNYGLESLTIGRRLTQGGVPDETIETFDQSDPSWQSDWRDLIDSIVDGRPPEVDAEAGLGVMQLADQVYAYAAQAGRTAGLPTG